jgi:WXG100 family type VII secretion target
MATMKVTPDQMDAIATQVQGQKTEWDVALQQINGFVTEMNTMWDGLGNDSFHNVFQQDIPVFQQLGQMMTEYQEAIKRAATAYRDGEQVVKSIVTRRG